MAKKRKKHTTGAHRFGPRRVTKSAERKKGRPVTAQTGAVEDLEKTIGKTGGNSPTLAEREAPAYGRRTREAKEFESRVASAEIKGA